MKKTTFTLFGFRRPREVVGLALGRLERAVLEETWRRGEISAGEIYHSSGQQTAYTTWMTTLDRLYKKGLLGRRKEGRAYVYFPRLSREEFERGVAEDVIDGLFEGDPGGVEPLLACIVDTVTERDRSLLDKLQTLIEEKKRALGAEEE